MFSLETWLSYGTFLIFPLYRYRHFLYSVDNYEISPPTHPPLIPHIVQSGESQWCRTQVTDRGDPHDWTRWSPWKVSDPRSWGRPHESACRRGLSRSELFLNLRDTIKRLQCLDRLTTTEYLHARLPRYPSGYCHVLLYQRRECEKIMIWCTSSRLLMITDHRTRDLYAHGYWEDSRYDPRHRSVLYRLWYDPLMTTPLLIDHEWYRPRSRWERDTYMDTIRWAHRSDECRRSYR